MSRVETALEELIAAVIASEEYREYDRQKQIMKEQPELKAQIDRFRRKILSCRIRFSRMSFLTGRMNFRGAWRSSAKTRWWTHS